MSSTVPSGPRGHGGPDPVQVSALFDPQASPIVAEATPPLPAVALERLEAPRLRERFSRPPAWAPESTGDRVRLYDGPPRPAAVLVPIVMHRGAPTVLLTRRTLHLRQHSGQVAFPGGRAERSDPDRVFTALRETREEIGLEPIRVEVIGRLPEYLTGTGFRITPVVGLIEPGCRMHADPHEVAAIFEVPLGFLMDPRHHQRRLIAVPGGERAFWAMPYRPGDSEEEYFIWGATAGMLRNLYRLLVA